MLASLTDEESCYLCQIICTLLKVGINPREPDTDPEFNAAMSELDEFLLTLSGPPLTEANKVLSAIFEFPDIEGMFYKEAKALIRGGTYLESASSLSNIYYRSEHLLQFIADEESADYYYICNYY